MPTYFYSLTGFDVVRYFLSTFIEVRKRPKMPPPSSFSGAAFSLPHKLVGLLFHMWEPLYTHIARATHSVLYLFGLLSSPIFCHNHRHIANRENGPSLCSSAAGSAKCSLFLARLLASSTRDLMDTSKVTSWTATFNRVWRSNTLTEKLYMFSVIDGDVHGVICGAEEK